MRKQLALFGLTVFAVIGIDWSSKALASRLLPTEALYHNPKPIIPLGVLFVVVVVSWLLWLVDTKWMTVATGIFFGGMIANVSDRALHGPVLDFIPAPIPVVFNVADFCLFLGVVMMLAALAIAVRQDVIGKRLPGKVFKALDRSSLGFLLVAVVAAVFCIDWTSKGLAVSMLPADSIVHNQRSIVWLILIPMIIAWSILFRTMRTRVAVTALAVLIGGCLANVTDRVLRGPVVDFISFSLPTTDLQVYINFADLAIISGALSLFVLAYKNHSSASW